MISVIPDIVAAKDDPTEPREPTRYPSSLDFHTNFCAIIYITATSNANKSTTAKNAQTGDNSRIEFWLALFGISGCVGIGAVIVGKRMKHRMK